MAKSEGRGDIAVVGMSCRVAGANSPSEFWDLLASSRDVQSEITRFNMNAFYHPDGGSRKGLTNIKDAYMLDDDKIDRFDHSFFQTTPVEAVAVDPQQRMLLEIAYEALESAGIPLENFVGTDTAVFAGKEITSLPVEDMLIVQQVWIVVIIIQFWLGTSKLLLATLQQEPRLVWQPIVSATFSTSQELVCPSIQHALPLWPPFMRLSGPLNVAIPQWLLYVVQNSF